MKVKELIAELKKCDPNAFVRCGEGPIWSVESKPGYYDGPYEHIDKSNPKKWKWIVSTKGTKVDLRTLSVGWFVMDHPEKVKDVVFEDGVSEHTIKAMKADMEESIQIHEDCEKRFEEENFPKMLKKYREGKLVVVQPANTKIGHYNQMWWCRRDNLDWMDFKRDGSAEHLCQGDCGMIIRRKDKRFKPVKYKNLYIWELIESK